MRTLLLAALSVAALLWAGPVPAQPARPVQAAAPVPPRPQGTPGPSQPAAAQPPTPAAAEPPPAPAANAPTLPNCPPDKDLCVQADRTGGIDLKTGVAHLEGNVRGVMKSRQLSFRSETLSAYRDGGKDWQRLVLDGNVHFRQLDQEGESDHGVVDHDEVHLSGHVHLKQTDMDLRGSQAEMRADGSHTVVLGNPMVLTVAKAVVPQPQNAPADGKAPPAAAPGDNTPPAAAPGAQPPASDEPTEGHPKAPAAPAVPVISTLTAEKAVIAGTPKHAELSGNVHVSQSDGSLNMTAEQVTLQFTKDSKLESFQAQGHVRIEQPERRVSADFARSGEDLKTIVLIGHATMQQKGQFELKSQRMVVYSDARKGIMQSNNEQKPITLSMDLSQPTYKLTQAEMLKLTQDRLPGAVLGKLTPLVGKSYSAREGLRKALAIRLSKHEMDAYGDHILDAARQGSPAK